MTENECIETLQYLLGYENAVDKGELDTPNNLNSQEKEALRMILEEIKAYRAIGTVEEMQKSVKEEDILKFYYIESEDKYVVGQRLDTLYYAEVGKTGLAFYMSRYLPWGEHVVSPDTLWKEYTYPSEPKEIPFFDWLQGFMKKEYGGTIEEFKALKEKNVAVKPLFSTVNRETVYHCGSCKKFVGFYDTRKYEYCHNCGQKIDWQ